MTTYRQATAEDIPFLIDISSRFFEESNFSKGLTIDKIQLAGTFGYMVQSPDHYVLLAKEKEQIIGFIIFDIVRYYTSEFVSHLFLFYVIPECRMSKIGRELLGRALLEAKSRGAKRFYGSSSAGLSDGGKTNKRLLSLYRNFGFEELGCFTMKGL